MKPFFIIPSIDKVKYLRGEYIYNKPINLSLCKSIAKSKYMWYPDNQGLFAIEFHGCDQRWVYEDNEKREADYQKIINNKIETT